MKKHLLVISLLLLISCSSAPDEIKIGVVAPLSGPVAQFGEFMKLGFDLAVEEINAAGGIDGKNVRLIYEDSKCIDQKALLSALNKLKDIDQVAGVLGPFCGTENVVAGQFATDNKMFIIAPGDNFGPNSTHKVNTRYLISKEAELLAQYALSKGWKRLGVLSFNNEWGQAYHTVIRDYLATHGGEVVIAEFYDYSSLDVRTPLLKIKEAKPDAVVFIDALTGELFTQVREIGLDVPLISEWEIENAAPSVLESGALDGVVYALPVTERTLFHDSFKAKYDQEPNVVHIDSYDAAKIMGDALRACPGYEPDCMVEKVTSLRDYKGAGGPMTFNKTLWAFDRPFVYKTVVNGSFVPLS